MLPYGGIAVFQRGAEIAIQPSAVLEDVDQLIGRLAGAADEVGNFPACAFIHPSQIFRMLASIGLSPPVKI